MSDKLKPCPFCDYGSSGLHETGFIQEKNRTVGAYYPNLYRQECQKCGATGPTSISKEEMTEAWNHRPTEDAIKAHAVEVLAKSLCESGGQWSFEHFEPNSGFRLKYINEAKALLGWDNDNNDKEK
jgi:hypothetical protein